MWGRRSHISLEIKQETLNGNEIHNWLTVNGTSVSVSESKAAEYVKNLASTCNTAYKPKTLKTSYGKTVTITTGNYGWKIDQAKETAALVSLIKNGEQTSREPEYSQKAASHSGNDYGNTYVEINLTAQHFTSMRMESFLWSRISCPEMPRRAGVPRRVLIPSRISRESDPERPGIRDSCFLLDAV